MTEEAYNKTVELIKSMTDEEYNRLLADIKRKKPVEKRYAEVLFYSDNGIRLSGVNNKCFYNRSQYPNIMPYEYVQYWVTKFGMKYPNKRIAPTNSYLIDIAIWDTKADNHELYNRMVETITKKYLGLYS